MNYSLDLTAYRCPIPLLAVKRAMVSLKQGEKLEVYLNNSATIQDFKLLAEQSLCELEIQFVKNKLKLQYHKKSSDILCS